MMIVFIIISVFFAWLTPPVKSFICDCTPASVSHKLSSSDLIFSGEIILVSKGNQVTFKVLQTWKGETKKEITVNVFDLPQMCGDMAIMRGFKYLIYASQDEKQEGQWITYGDCGNNVILHRANFDLKMLDCAINHKCKDLPVVKD
jgi:hypothetical protein